MTYTKRWLWMKELSRASGNLLSKTNCIHESRIMPAGWCSWAQVLLWVDDLSRARAGFIVTEISQARGLR